MIDIEENRTSVIKINGKNISLETINYKLLTENPYFRRLSNKNLTTILEYMDFDSFGKIEGYSTKEKLKTLKQIFKNKTKMKKVAAKKVENKTVETPKFILPDVTPLFEFDGYGIDRKSSTISFGCGEVEISRVKLKKFAEFLASNDSKTFSRNIHLVEEFRVEVITDLKGALNLKQMKEVVSILESENFSKNMELLKGLANETNGRYDVNDLLSLDVKTIAGILGKPKRSKK